MRLMSLISAASILVSGPVFAQEWSQCVSRTDFFEVNFQGEPKVREITYSTEYGISLPGRLYTGAPAVR
jgi:hypothetical protein